MELFWLPPPTASLNSQCFDDGVCGVSAFGLCGFPVGTFQSGESFDTSPRETVHRTLQLSSQTAQQKACTANMLLILGSSSYGYANLVSTGNVQAKTALRNFGKVSVQETIYVLE
jgi:hypothetical protein